MPAACRLQIGQRRQRIGQPMHAARIIRQLDLDPQQIHAGGQQIEPRHGRAAHRIGQGALVEQHIKAGNGAVVLADAEPGACIALRVKIDQQNLLANGGQRRAQINRCCGFANAAFLIGETQNTR